MINRADKIQNKQEAETAMKKLIVNFQEAKTQADYENAIVELERLTFFLESELAKTQTQSTLPIYRVNLVSEFVNEFGQIINVEIENKTTLLDVLIQKMSELDVDQQMPEIAAELRGKVTEFVGNYHAVPTKETQNEISEVAYGHEVFLQNWEKEKNILNTIAQGATNVVLPNNKNIGDVVKNHDAIIPFIPKVKVEQVDKTSGAKKYKENKKKKQKQEIADAIAPLTDVKDEIKVSNVAQEILDEQRKLDDDPFADIKLKTVTQEVPTDSDDPFADVQVDNWSTPISEAIPQKKESIEANKEKPISESREKYNQFRQQVADYTQKNAQPLTAKRQDLDLLSSKDKRVLFKKFQKISNQYRGSGVKGKIKSVFSKRKTEYETYKKAVQYLASQGDFSAKLSLAKDSVKAGKGQNNSDRKAARGLFKEIADASALMPEIKETQLEAMKFLNKHTVFVNEQDMHVILSKYETNLHDINHSALMTAESKMTGEGQAVKSEAIPIADLADSKEEAPEIAPQVIVDDVVIKPKHSAADAVNSGQPFSVTANVQPTVTSNQPTFKVALSKYVQSTQYQEDKKGNRILQKYNGPLGDHANNNLIDFKALASKNIDDVIKNLSESIAAIKKDLDGLQLQDSSGATLESDKMINQYFFKLHSFSTKNSPPRSLDETFYNGVIKALGSYIIGNLSRADIKIKLIETMQTIKSDDSALTDCKKNILLYVGVSADKIDKFENMFNALSKQINESYKEYSEVLIANLEKFKAVEMGKLAEQGDRYDIEDFKRNFEKAITVLSNNDTKQKQVFQEKLPVGIRFEDVTKMATYLMEASNSLEKTTEKKSIITKAKEFASRLFASEKDASSTPTADAKSVSTAEVATKTEAQREKEESKKPAREGEREKYKGHPDPNSQSFIMKKMTVKIKMPDSKAALMKQSNLLNQAEYSDEHKKGSVKKR